MIGVVNEAFGEIEGQIFDIKRRSSLKYRAGKSSPADKIDRETEKLSETLEGVIRETIKQHVAPRRNAAESQTSDEDEKSHKEFAELVHDKLFHGMAKLPAVLHSIKFAWPEELSFEIAIEAVKGLGVQNEILGNSIIWFEHNLVSELRRDGVLRRASTNDIHSSVQMQRARGHHGTPDYISANLLQMHLVARIEADCKFLYNLGIKPPWTVGVSIIRGDGFMLLDGSDVQAPRQIQSQIVGLPLTRMTSPEQFKDMASTGAALRKALDYCCRSVGWRGSDRFNSDGTWNSRTAGQ